MKVQLATAVVVAAFSQCASATMGHAFGRLVRRQLSQPAPPGIDSDVPLNVTTYDLTSHTLATETYMPNHYQTGPYVANGYFGQRLPSEGMGYWVQKNLTGTAQPVNGWPLDNPRATFGTIAGFWDRQKNTTRTNFAELLDRGDESVISGIPDWTGLYVTTSKGATYEPGVDNTTITKFKQTMSLTNGVVSTQVTWEPEGGTKYVLNYTILAHKASINVGLVKLELSTDKDTTVTITDILDGGGAVRTVFGDKSFEEGNSIWTSVKPVGIENVTAYEYSTVSFSGSGLDHKSLDKSRKDGAGSKWVSTNSSTVAQEWTVKLKARTPVTVIKYVGIASSDGFKRTLSTAEKASLTASKLGWNKLMESHNKAWDALWEDADIIIPGDEEIQISARATLFHLLANVLPGTSGAGLGDNSISVGGLTSDSYAGLVFWDADLWMFPGLLSLHPEHAMNINNYRTKLAGQAVANAQSYNFSGLLFPWTSARFGNCTGTGPCVDYQYHLNSDIAHAQWTYFQQTNDTAWLKAKGWPIIGKVADMFANFVVKNGTTDGKYWTFNMTDPDEYANHIDNGGFTNIAIKKLLGEWAPQAAKIVGAKVPSNWSDIAENILIPYNEKEELIEEFVGMNGSVEIKQADVVLTNYPLEFQISETQAMNDLTFYAQAQSPDGPAMTWAIFAIAQAQLQASGCASYTYLLYGSQPYLEEPYYQFGEQLVDSFYANGGTNPAFPFLTGHGGYLQVFTNGFTGHRPRLDAFYLDPSLPPQLDKGITVKGMKWQGASFDVDIQLDKTTITRKPVSGRHQRKRSATVRIGGKNKKAGDYKLAPGQKLVIPTRRPDLNGTVIAGNHAQCKPAVSDQTWTPGNFPLSAFDGSNATVWQPSASTPASVIVDLGASRTISGVSLNWGHIPPTKFAIAAAPSRDGTYTEIYSTESVPITDPWEEEDALIVSKKIGNTTVQHFDKKYQGRFVRLVIEGSQGEDQTEGATVAEFAVL